MRGRASISWVAAVVVLLAASVAGAQPASPWDHTYKHEATGGAWPCPDPGADVTVSGARFSIPWDVQVDGLGSAHAGSGADGRRGSIDAGGPPSHVTIAHIEGTVRADGVTTATVSYVRPPPPELVAQAQATGQSLDVLRGIRLTVKFKPGATGRTLSLVSRTCSATWREVQAPPKPVGLNCNSGEYAVALWSTERAYKLGEFARLAGSGGPTKLYRCVGACAAGANPSADPAWSMFGDCAAQGGAAAPPPAGGADKWDAAYKQRAQTSTEWRCFDPGALDTLAILHGHFAIPWNVHVTRTDGSGDVSVPVGRIEGTVAADGSAAVHATFTVQSLPPDVAAVARASGPGQATIAYLKAAIPMVVLSMESSTRRMHLALGSACTIDFDAR